MPCQIAVYHLQTLMVLTRSSASVSAGATWQMHLWSHHTVDESLQKMQFGLPTATYHASAISSEAQLVSDIPLNHPFALLSWLLSNGESRLRYPGFLGRHTWSKDFSSIWVESILLLCPQIFNRMKFWWGDPWELRGGCSKFLTRSVVRKKWQIRCETFVWGWGWSLQLWLQCRQHRKMIRVDIATEVKSALTDQLTTRR